MNEKTYTTREVARMLGVTVQTVQRWVDAGVLRAWRTAGGHRRLAVDSVDNFVRNSRLQLQGEQGPTSANATGASPAPPHVQSDAAPCVLVVDDDENDRELAVRAVRGLLPAARILEADNGFSGLIQLGRTAVDVLITDIHMPELDGLAMLRALRADPATAAIRIAAMSSYDLDEIGRRGGLPAGVAFLPKPLGRQRVGDFLLSPAKTGAA
ncbi:excisionase family DNA-binding protein [Aquimonas voraii]|uniref:DNA binding domain-containing protein, excisionase family n=1 Tax=Aquimonas voraii TaxID=265719 RepID=A0A1G6ZHB3_9GAMM|nr:excisionase family DNA-binding protein [Aquimonas voraii]SDE02048.1 DNA binding domain-containing protein, excisionase family [Aquimonas voraii]